MPVGKAKAATAKGNGEDFRFVVPCFTKIDEVTIRDHLERDHFFWLDLTAPGPAELSRRKGERRARRRHEDGRRRDLFSSAIPA